MIDTLLEGLPALGLTLNPETAKKLCAFGEAVIEQNKVMNLTAITQPEQVAKLHLLDSLCVLSAQDLRHKKVIDVGCGAGFPGVPLKIACPEMQLTLLDSLGKRMHWLETVLPTLGVDAQCVTARAEEAVAVYRERYVPTGMFENTPYPGVREMLESLVSAGHTLYVASSKPEWMCVEILKHFDLAGYFKMICGATMDTSRTNKEAVIEYLIRENGRADNMIMVGDTKFDVIGAKAHGIPCIGVSWGYGTVEEMEEAGAASIAFTMDQLGQMLQEI